MPARPAEVAQLITSDGRAFDRFETMEVFHEIGQPSRAVFELGDERAFLEIGELLRPGSLWTAAINDVPHVTGRGEILEAPAESGRGHRLMFTIRTRLSDAFIGSARTSVKVENKSIAQFIADLFASIGYKPENIVFDARSAVNLMSGEGSKFSGKKSNLEPIQVQQAKVQPGESIMDAATRHLERHGLILLDLPNDKLAIIYPDVNASTSYHLRGAFGFTAASASANNLLAHRRVYDWTAVPSTVTIYGATYGGDLAKAPVWGARKNDEVYEVALRPEGHFNRNVISVQNNIRDTGQAIHRTRREMQRLRASQDTWELLADGAMHWDGHKLKPYLPTALAEVDVEAAGGPTGKFFLKGVRLKCSNDGHTASLSAVRYDLVEP